MLTVLPPERDLALCVRLLWSVLCFPGSAAQREREGQSGAAKPQRANADRRQLVDMVMRLLQTLFRLSIAPLYRATDTNARVFSGHATAALHCRRRHAKSTIQPQVAPPSAPPQTQTAKNTTLASLGRSAHTGDTHSPCRFKTWASRRCGWGRIVSPWLQRWRGVGCMRGTLITCSHSRLLLIQED